LLYYQESTSEDEQIEDDLIPSHSEFDEYLFSDEEEESNQEDAEDGGAMDDMNEGDDGGGAAKTKLKKEVASFKKKSQSISKNSLLKKVCLVYFLYVLIHDF
jgi:hypothetical protein